MKPHVLAHILFLEEGPYRTIHKHVGIVDYTFIRCLSEVSAGPVKAGPNTYVAFVPFKPKIIDSLEFRIVKVLGLIIVR